MFIVNTVPLVYQQAQAIRRHTALTVGAYEGSMGTDFWTDEKVMQCRKLLYSTVL